MIKQCERCHRILSQSHFHKDKNSRDGLRSICKECACRKTRENRKKLIRQTNGLHDVYYDMLKRCNDPNARGYARYGGRGISVCKLWTSNFQEFQRWCKSHGYSRGLQLDRIDNDGNYCPENCRFVTRSQNQHNTSMTKLNEEAIRFIRDNMKTRQFTQDELALRFGVSQARISAVCRNETWKDVK